MLSHDWVQRGLVLMKRLLEILRSTFGRAVSNRDERDMRPVCKTPISASYPEDTFEAGLTKARELLQEGRLAQAAALYRSLLQSNPDCFEALHLLGVAEAQQQNLEAAAILLGRAIAIDPGNTGALSNYGNILRLLMRHEDALASYDKALALNPANADALNNRGGLLRDMGQHERASQDYARLSALNPDFEYALGNKLHSNLHSCDWQQYHEIRAQVIDAVRGGKRACYPFDFLAISEAGADQLQCAQTYVAHKCPLAVKPLWSGERYGHMKIRLAYVSADLRNHAVAYLMADLFERHDRSKFEVSAWSFGPDTEDEMRARLRKSFEHFHDVRQMTDYQVATRLRAQEIDIAIDLNGFTTYCRPAIFAHRAVPLQVGYLGYIGTMGAGYMDYIIADAEAIPVAHEAYYAEKVARLPDTYQVNQAVRVMAERTPPRAELGLPESGLVFCCFNNTYKITPEVFESWMRLLNRVEGSVLWLLESNAATVRNLRAVAEAGGVRPDRLVFAPRVPAPEYLARFKRADIFLDTLPYNAGTTASDALWAGLPVVTCAGNAFAGRMAASLLRAIGLPELVTDNLAAYEALAFKLATTPAMLKDLTATLSRNRNTYPLFDADRFRRHIESAYVWMYERHQRGEPPQSFSVAPVDTTGRSHG